MCWSYDKLGSRMTPRSLAEVTGWSVEPRKDTWGSSGNLAISCLLRQLNWLPVKQMLHLKDAVMTYKCVYGLAPLYLSVKLTKRSNIHSRNTRKRDSLNIPLFRTTAGQRTFQYRAASIWNNLDSQMKNYSLKKFKVEMKDKLLSSVL